MWYDGAVRLFDEQPQAFFGFAREPVWRKDGCMGKREKREIVSKGPIRVRYFWAGVVLVWALAVLLRIVSAETFGDGTASGENGAQYVIHTHDAGYHGYQAQAFLGQAEPRGVYTLAAVLPAVLTKITPFSLDEILFFLPVFLAPLIVFPLAWLGRRWIADLPALGLACLSSFLAGYYQRTHAGYYDTDILNVFFPLMIVVFFLKLVDDGRVRWLIAAVALALLYDWWYGSARAMLFLLAGGLLLHTVLQGREKPARWQAVLVFGLAVFPLAPWMRIPGLALALLFFFWAIPRLGKHLRIAAWLGRQTTLWLIPVAFAGMVWLAAGGAAHIGSLIDAYLGKTPTIDIAAGKSILHFASASGTIVESTGVSTTLYLKTFAGHVILGWLSLVGLAALIWRVRETVVLLPLVILGVLGFVSGIRFAIYLAPLALFGFVWGAFHLVRRMTAGDQRLAALVLLILLLAPAWFHGNEVVRWNREVTLPVFDAGQVAALTQAAQESGSEARAFAWWDYGWPLWHSGRWQTIVDNGTHGYADSYLVSRALMATNQAELAGLAALATGEKQRQPGEQAIAGLLQRFGNLESIIAQAVALSQTNQAGAVSTTIVLPWQMRYLLYTIDKFSRRDPGTGGMRDEKVVWILGRIIGRDGNRILVGQTLAPRMTGKTPRFLADTESGVVEMHEGKSRLSRWVRVAWQGGRPRVDERTWPGGSGVTLVEDIHGVILMHERLYRSNFVQMALLGRVDETLFRVTHGSPTLLLAKTRQVGR